MKINQLVNWGTFSIAVLGTLFKVMHWPGANIMLVVTFIILLISTILSFRSNRDNGLGNTFNYVLTSLLLLLIIGACFSTMHWPGGSELSAFGHLILLVLPVMALTLNKDNKISNSFWVAFLILIFVILSLVRSKINTLEKEIEGIDKIETPK